MRKAIVGVAILTLIAGVAIRAQSPLDAPTTLRLPTSLPNCGVNSVILTIARASRVATGFEEDRDDIPGCAGWFAQVDVMHGDGTDRSITVRQVLDQLVALAPRYRWVDMYGVAVIRPVAAWTDPSNILNGRVAPLHSANATVSDTLDILLRTPRAGESGFNHLNFNKPPFTMMFEGGTMIDALNALVRASGDAGWAARVRHASGQDGTPALQLTIRTFDVGDRALHAGGIIGSAPVSRLGELTSPRP